MKRLLLTFDQGKCPFRCRYCFANFSQYERPPSLSDLEAQPQMLNGVDFIYPACDVDIFALTGALEVLRRIALFERSISVSTKARLAPRLVNDLGEVNARLHGFGCFLKVGISFATKHSVAVIEPGTASFDDRVRNLQLLNGCSIPSCAVIKPVLPEVDISEYLEIIDSVAPWTKSIVLGDLYLDSADVRVLRANPAERTTAVGVRRVNWAIRAPLWPTIACPEKQQRIIRYAESLGMTCFISDLAFMCDLHQNLPLRQRQHDLALVD